MAVLERTPTRSLSRPILTLLAAVLWGLGWLAGKTCTVIMRLAAWSLAAFKLGWSDARGVPNRR